MFRREFKIPDGLAVLSKFAPAHFAVGSVCQGIEYYLAESTV
jgi:hypothetical protein